MKRFLLFVIAVITSYGTVVSQTFFDDFDSYAAGDYLAASNSEWTTWGGTTGTSEDVRISDEAAYSGTNSIKFASSAPNGGPQDVVKYFTGQKITSGVLMTSMRMLVETGAYFNYQGEVSIGSTWSMNAFFEAGGQGRITGSGNNDVLTFDYPQGEWFDFNMTINFDANKWQLEVNGICVGSFSNPDNSIASIDIFPVQGNSFFIDDFGYEYQEVAAEIERDAIIELEVSEARGLAGITTELSGVLSNGGLTEITSFEAQATVGGEVIPVSMDGLSLQKGESVSFLIDEDHEVAAGSSEVTLSLVSINGGTFDDEDLCNDASTVDLFGLVPADGKKVIIEEGTGTWCGWCPRGAVALERLTHRYPDTYIGIAVHNGDPMTVDEYDTALATPGYPNSMVNRFEWVDPGQSEGPFLQRVVEPSPARIVQGAKFDEATRELSISLNITALQEISTDHKVNVVITEDGVTGTTTGYAQSNYYSGQQDLIDIHGVNYRDLPDPIPASDIVYDHVARAMLAPFGGMDQSFFEVLEVGSVRIINMTYTVPAEFNIDKMNIVSMLINPDGTLDTGEGDSVAEAIENGWEQGITAVYDQAFNDAVSIFPNPASEFTTVQMNVGATSDVTLQLVDVTGQSIRTKTYPRQVGVFRTAVDVSTLAPGTYILQVQAGEKLSTQKIYVVR